MRLVVVSLVLLLAGPGCLLQLDVPNQALISCSEDSECPSGWVCRSNIGRCVQQSAIDGAPPIIMAHAAAIRPRVARLGDDLTITLTASTKLAVPPVVRLRDPAGGPSLTLETTSTSDDGYRYSLRAAPLGTERQTDWTAVAILTDNAGHTSDEIVIGSIRLDFTPPAFSAPPVVFPARLGRGGAASLTLSLSERLLAPAVVSLVSTIDPSQTHNAYLVGAVEDATNTYHYEYAGDALPEGEADLVASAIDEAGNTATLTARNALTFKHTAPIIKRVLGYVVTPDPLRRPIVSTTVASTASSVLVSLEFNEVPGAAPLLQIVAPVVQACSVASTAGAVVDFLCAFDPLVSYPNGTYQLAVKVTDDLGNTATRSVALSPPLQFKSSALAPPHVDLPGCIVYHRSPWGSASSNGVPQFSLSGCAGAVDAEAHSVVVLDRAQVADAAPLGQATVASDGSFGPIVLPTLGSSRLYLVAVDAAGNASAAAAVRDVEVVASLTRKQATDNPHKLWTTPSFAASLDQDPSHTQALAPSGSLDDLDGQVVTASAFATWSLRNGSTSSTPLPRTRSAMVYDSARGRVVLFGGLDDTHVFGDTWEFDGRMWTQIPSAIAPPPRADHAMAYDERRGRVVLFGGSGLKSSLSYQDTWEWDGVLWRNVSPNLGSPSARRGHSMAYDANDQRVLLFGGIVSSGALQETWTFDGLSWTQAAPAHQPSARQHAAMAFAPSFASTMLFGGEGSSPPYLDMWSWSAGDWHSVSLVAGVLPNIAALPVMTFDATANRLALVGDNTWFFDPIATSPQIQGKWQAQPNPLPGRQCPHAAYHAASGSMVVFGGAARGSCASPVAVGLATGTYLRQGDRFRDITPSVLQAGASDRHTAAFDPLLGTALFYGGKIKGSWTWNGAGWSQPPLNQVPAFNRARHALAYFPRTQSTVLFGGLGVSSQIGLCRGLANRCGDTWEFGVFGLSDCPSEELPCWRALSLAGPAQPGLPRIAHAMAFHAGLNEMILFGGECGPGFPPNCSDTWHFDGSTWTQQGVNGATPPRLARHAMAYDQARDRIVMFGGQDPGATCAGSTVTDSDCNETWEYGLHGTPTCTVGSSACWKLVSTSGPAPRSSHTLVYDRDRARVILYGGANEAVPQTSYSDVWEFDGLAWSQLSIAGAQPEGRFAHAMHYDTLSQRSVLYDGNLGYGDLWELDNTPSRKPAVIADFDLSNELRLSASVTALTITASAGGVGHTTNLVGPSAPRAGTVLSSWSAQKGQWVSLANNTQGLGSPGTLVSTPSGAQALVQHNGHLSVAVHPVASAGNSAADCSVELDYIDVRARLRY